MTTEIFKNKNFLIGVLVGVAFLFILFSLMSASAPPTNENPNPNPNPNPKIPKGCKGSGTDYGTGLDINGNPCPQSLPGAGCPNNSGMDIFGDPCPSINTNYNNNQKCDPNNPGFDINGQFDVICAGTGGRIGR